MIGLFILIFLISPWLLLLFLNGCFMMFGGRFKIKYVKHQGLVVHLKIRHPIKFIREALDD